MFNRIVPALAAKAGKSAQLTIDATHLKAHRPRPAPKKEPVPRWIGRTKGGLNSLSKTVRHRTNTTLNNRLEQHHRGIKGRSSSAPAAVTTRSFQTASAAPASQEMPALRSGSCRTHNPAVSHEEYWEPGASADRPSAPDTDQRQKAVRAVWSTGKASTGRVSLGAGERSHGLHGLLIHIPWNNMSEADRRY